MPKTLTPDQLRDQAEKLTQQAAEAQAALHAAAEEERQREWKRQLEADQQLVDTFSAATLDQAVDAARTRLDAAVAELPVTQALGDYIAAQNRRNYTYLELSAARGRLGLPETGMRQASTDVGSLQEYVEQAATRIAQDRINAERNA